MLHYSLLWERSLLSEMSTLRFPSTLGIITGGGAFATRFLESSTPTLQWVGLVLAVMTALIVVIDRTWNLIDRIRGKTPKK